MATPAFDADELLSTRPPANDRWPTKSHWWYRGLRLCNCTYVTLHSIGPEYTRIDSTAANHQSIARCLSLTGVSVYTSHPPIGAVLLPPNTSKIYTVANKSNPFGLPLNSWLFYYQHRLYARYPGDSKRCKHRRIGNRWTTEVKFIGPVIPEKWHSETVKKL